MQQSSGPSGEPIVWPKHIKAGLKMPWVAPRSIDCKTRGCFAPLILNPRSKLGGASWIGCLEVAYFAFRLFYQSEGFVSLKKTDQPPDL